MRTDIHALVGAYALDAIDDLERVAFDRHLAGCESCRTEVVELRETASRLADGAWSVPPPRLRENVMTAIGRTRQLPPGGSRRSGRDATASRWLRYTAAAAAAVVLAGGAGAAAWTVQDQRVRDQRALAEAAEQREARTRAILAAPDLVVRTAPMVGGGKVTVASSALQDAAVVLLGADAPPSGGRVFELWTIRGTTPTSAGVLAPGQASAVQIVDGLPGSDAFGVTVEPAGGSLAPTLPLVATVQLT
jgi:anti-sigma-K factor RskA